MLMRRKMMRCCRHCFLAEVKALSRKCPGHAGLKSFRRGACATALAPLLTAAISIRLYYYCWRARYGTRCDFSAGCATPGMPASASWGFRGQLSASRLLTCRARYRMPAGRAFQELRDSATLSPAACRFGRRSRSTAGLYGLPRLASFQTSRPAFSRFARSPLRVGAYRHRADILPSTLSRPLGRAGRRAPAMARKDGALAAVAALPCRWATRCSNDDNNATCSIMRAGS